MHVQGSGVGIKRDSWTVVVKGVLVTCKCGDMYIVTVHNPSTCAHALSHAHFLTHDLKLHLTRGHFPFARCYDGPHSAYVAGGK